MARPIEPTPTLRGRSVDLFCMSITDTKYSPKKDNYLKEAREIHRQVNKNRSGFPTILKRGDD